MDKNDDSGKLGRSACGTDAEGIGCPPQELVEQHGMVFDKIHKGSLPDAQEVGNMQMLGFIMAE